VHASDPESHYVPGGLYHLKLALEKVALSAWDDPALTAFKTYGNCNGAALTRFVRNCGVYFLAGAFGDIRQEIRRRLPDFGLNKADYIAVNLAVPVADGRTTQSQRAI
jgi:hypothetical protein